MTCANTPPMPIIVGSPRSGTTLLRLMIDAHPLVAIPPETGFLELGERLAEGTDSAAQNFLHNVTSYPEDAPNWGDFGLDSRLLREELLGQDSFDLGNALRAFYRLYAARFGKSRWGEKTPMYCRHMATIERLLPEAHFIHIVRDGRDAALSLRERWFSPGHDISVQAQYWRDNVVAARTQGRECRRFLELRFEDLICDAQKELRRICAFLEIEYCDGMLEYHLGAQRRLAEHGARVRVDGSVVVSREQRRDQQAQTCREPDCSRIGQWKRHLSPAEAAGFEEIAGDVLAQYGYA